MTSARLSCLTRSDGTKRSGGDYGTQGGQSMGDAAREIKDRHRMVWGLGNYAEVARFLLPASEHVAAACAIGPGKRVLDVGAGTGNLAVTAAKMGADVTAIDLSPQLLEIGKQRSLDEGLSIEWQLADAEELPFEDNSFDVVTSVFGAMFAPRASHTAGELLRVVKAGGVVGFTAWASDGYTGLALELAAKFGPPVPPGVNTAGEWGDEAVARERFESHGANVEVRSGEIVWDFESKQASRAFKEENTPPIVAAKMVLPPEKFEEMMTASSELEDRFNRGKDGRVTIDARYLLILAHKSAGG